LDKKVGGRKPPIAIPDKPAEQRAANDRTNRRQAHGRCRTACPELGRQSYDQVREDTDLREQTEGKRGRDGHDA
jgi:hypothetical protein